MKDMQAFAAEMSAICEIECCCVKMCPFSLEARLLMSALCVGLVWEVYAKIM